MAGTHVVLEFEDDGSIAIRGEGWFRVPANFETLDEITDLFRFTKADADAFVMMMAGGRISARFSAREIASLDLADLKRQNTKADAAARKRLENLPPPIRCLPRHVTDYGRRLATRHAAEQVFEPEHRVIVEKVKSRHTANGVRLTRRVETFRTKG